LDEIVHVICYEIVRAWCLVSTISAYDIVQLVVLNACHFGPECHDLRSELVIVL
jgi:hypothetical protein